MDKLISQQAAIDEAEKWFFNLKDKRSPGEVLNDLPSVQLSGIDDEQELISKEQAIDKIKERLFETAFNNVGIKQNIDETIADVAENRLENWFNELPSVQPKQNEMIKEIRRWVNSENRGNADYFIVDRIEEIINAYEIN